MKIQLKIGAAPKPANDPRRAMLKEFGSVTEPNPINPRERVVVVNGQWVGVVELGLWSNVMTLSLIRSFEGKQGAGTAMLKLVTELADRHGVTLMLDAVPVGKGGPSAAKLKAWYRKHGFVGTSAGSMVRQPK